MDDSWLLNFITPSLSLSLLSLLCINIRSKTICKECQPGQLWFIEKTRRKSNEEYWEQSAEQSARYQGCQDPGLASWPDLSSICPVLGRPLLMAVQSSYANLIHHNIGKSRERKEQWGHWSSHCCNSTQDAAVQLSLSHCLPTMDQFQPRQPQKREASGGASAQQICHL